MTNILYQISETATDAGIAENSMAKTKPGRFLKQYLVSYKLQVLLIVLLGFINSCSNFLLTLIIGDFFIIQFHTHSSKGKLLHRLGIEIAGINSFFLLFGILLLVKLATGYAAKFLSLKQGELFVKNIREQLFFSQVNSPAGIFAQKPFGNYLLRYSNDMKAVQNLLTKGVLGSVNEALFLVTGLLLITLIHPVLAFIIFVLILTFLLFVKTMVAMQRKFISLSRDKRSNMLAFVTKTFRRFNRMKQEGTEEIIEQGFINKSTDLFDSNIKNGKIESMLQVLAGLIPFFVIGIILLLVSMNLVRISVSDGLLTVLILLLIQGTVRRLLTIPGLITKGMISLNKINEILIL